MLLHRSIKSSGLESGSAGAAAAQAKEAGRSSPESGTARALAPAEVGGAGGGGLGLESGRSASLAGFDMEEETDLARAGALQSSLWELLALREHHLRGVSGMADDDTAACASSATSVPYLSVLGCARSPSVLLVDTVVTLLCFMYCLLVAVPF